MDRKIAEQIVALANGVIDQLLVSLEPVQRGVSADEFAAYKRGIAKAINALDTEVIDRIAREHPDLKPADDEGDPVEPDPPKASRN